MNEARFDVAVVGAGLAGMANALLLQSAGLSTVLIEAHSRLGGCAGFYRRSGFSFDIGATTLVDFEADGVGARFLSDAGIGSLDSEALPGYMAWLPDRTVEVARDIDCWRAQRLTVLGDTPAHRAFWRLLDDIADTYWQASRRGIRLPVRSVKDVVSNLRAADFAAYRYARYLRWTIYDALDHFGLTQDRALVGLISMMVEDTVHAQLRSAPLINAALGISIRGAGLSRPFGGMRGFWRVLSQRYIQLGGQIRLRTRVDRIEGELNRFALRTARYTIGARQVVCSLPLGNASTIAPDCFNGRAKGYLSRDAQAQGGGLVLCLGVPAAEVSESHQGHRHHQLLQSYDQPLGNGNNMFISVSAGNDTLCAPPAHRAVMVSTHCELSDWEGLSAKQYKMAKQSSARQLLHYAQRVYPRLGSNALVCELGTPRSYARFTSRDRGAVGGVRLTMDNANQNAVPYDLGVRGFWLVGDGTWPGVGTVACVIGARHVARDVLRLVRRSGAATGQPAPSTIEDSRERRSLI